MLDKHHEERAEREATRREGYNSEKRLQKTFKDLQPGDAGYAKAQQSSLAERAKYSTYLFCVNAVLTLFRYQFEADSEDEDMEKEIDSNLDALSGAASRLNGLARATGKEVDEQNRHLERINAKVKCTRCSSIPSLSHGVTDDSSRVPRWMIKLL